MWGESSSNEKNWGKSEEKKSWGKMAKKWRWWAKQRVRCRAVAVCPPPLAGGSTSPLIPLTISGHFTHTQSTYNHKKWKLIKHNKSGFNHIFTFANTLTNTQSTAWWSHLWLWSGVVLGSSGGVGLCNVSRCWTVSHRGTCLSYNWLSGLCWRHNKNV